MYGLMDRCIDKWIFVRTDGWMNIWIDVRIYVG